MAFRKGIANSHRDMLKMLYGFLTSSKQIGEPDYDVANTGDGFLSAEWADDSTGIVDDDWTITLTSATAFDVSGASYGAQASGTVDVPYVSDNGEVGFIVAIGTIPFVSGDEITFSTYDGLPEVQKWVPNRLNEVLPGDVSYGANTGTGLLTGTPNGPNFDIYAPEETWTITCITTPSASPATFSVVGSIQGPLAVATAGTFYDNGFINFTITIGGIDFVIDDLIYFTVPHERELQLMAPGNGGTEEVFVSIQTYEVPGSDRYQWKLNGNTGWNPTLNFFSQPGCISVEDADHGMPRILFQDREMPYWIVANGRRVTMFYDVGDVIECMYMGFLLSYGLPGENPYPLMIGGTTLNSTFNWTSTDSNHRAWWDNRADNWNDPDKVSCICHDGSAWHRIAGQCSGGYYDNRLQTNWFGAMWPYANAGASADLSGSPGPTYNWHAYWWGRISKNLDDTYPLFPLIPHSGKPNKVIWGEVEGVFAVPGLSLNAKDYALVGPSGSQIEYVYFPNTHITQQNSWAALRLE